MGVGKTFAEAFVKSQLAASVKLPTKGRAFISVRNADKQKIAEIGAQLLAMGFELYATRGTAAALSADGLMVTVVNKVAEGRPHVVDMIKNNEISFIVNVVDDKRAVRDSVAIRRAALAHRVTYYTTLAGAKAACIGMQAMSELTVYDLQGLHKQLTA
ncbi:MAG: carbamoyl phosphate synthase large subunit, partial [Sulfuriferula sp.]